MGARYARAANAVEPDKLALAPRRVLVAMALRVLDTPRGDTPAGHYYGGQYRLLGDLGTMPTRTSLRALDRHMQTLTEARLIERTRAAAPGKRAVYKLTVSVDNLPP